MFKKLFLPVGMLIAVAVAFALPEPGIAFKGLKLSGLKMNDLLIILIFLVCGWQTTADLKMDRKFACVFTSGAFITLILAPFAGWVIARAFSLDPFIAAGLMVIASMPPTLSSGVVITGTAGGNTLLAMTVTIGYSFIGVFILPVILPLLMPEGAEIHVRPLKMLTDLALLVILPAVAGVGLRLLTRKKLPSWCGHIPSLCVILLVWGFSSGARSTMLKFPVSTLLAAGAGSLLLHLALMAGMWYGSALFKAGIPERKAMLFTGASKTLTIALATLSILDASGEAVVPCMVFYFLQMLIDSSLAGKMAAAGEKSGKISGTA